MKRVFAGLAGLLVVSLASGVGAGGERSERPDLSGRWVLNKEKSDDPAKKMQEMQAGSRGFGGGMGGPGGFGGGGGMGGGRMGGGRGGGMGRPSQGGERPPEMMAEPPLDGSLEEAGTPRREDGPSERRRPRGPVPTRILEIRADGELIQLLGDRGERTILADGKSHPKDGPFPMNIAARWKKSGLEVETKSERGGGRVERYALKNDQLAVEFESAAMGPMPGYKFRLVYDRSKE
jgi:hypothetical protein